MQTTKRRQHLQMLVTLAVFCALAYVCQYVFRIKVSFLTFDAKDAVMTVGAMLFGPIHGVAMALVVSLLELISISDTGVYGFVMNFASSAAFAGLAAWIYRYKRTMTGAILGLCAAVVSMTALMLAMNLLITPYYLGAPVEQVAALIPTLLLPFNLTKSLLNAGLVLVLYRPISVGLKNARILPGEPTPFRFDRKTVLVLLAGLALIAICVVVFLVLMHGNFELHK
jgi:riboflavin transporter FmnP